LPAMACLSRLAVASVNTHRTRWPTPTPTQTRGVTYIYVLKCITHTAPLRTGLPLSFRLLQPSLSSCQPLGYTDTELHHYYLAGPGTFLPAESEFCKSRPRASYDNIQAEAEAQNSIAHASLLMQRIRVFSLSLSLSLSLFLALLSGQRWIRDR